MKVNKFERVFVEHTLFEGSRSSTSKFDVSLGLFTTGIYGAVARNQRKDDEG